jgi:glycosyltransferase involved in cell wall biosynthesis
MAEILHRVRAVDTGLETEIVVVDGSTDGTQAILQGEASAEDTKVIYHQTNQGKGAAVRTALQHAAGDILLVQDADLEYDPREYPDSLRPILEGRSQVVYGSRFRGGPHKAMFFWHMVGNKLLTLVTNILFNTILSDVETGYKVFTREVADRLRLKSRQWGFDPEITAHILKMGYRIYQVPISYTGREFTEGKKISWPDGFVVLWTLLKHRFLE